MKSSSLKEKKSEDPMAKRHRFGGNLTGIIAIGLCSSAADPLVRFSTPARTNSRAVSLRD